MMLSADGKIRVAGTLQDAFLECDAHGGLMNLFPDPMSLHWPMTPHPNNASFSVHLFPKDNTSPSNIYEHCYANTSRTIGKMPPKSTSKVSLARIATFNRLHTNETIAGRPPGLARKQRQGQSDTDSQQVLDRIAERFWSQGARAHRPHVRPSTWLQHHLQQQRLHRRNRLRPPPLQPRRRRRPQARIRRPSRRITPQPLRHRRLGPPHRQEP